MGDEDDFLPVVVEGDHLVEQHQVHIPELLLVRRVQPQGRLGIPDVLISEIAHQAAGEGRQKRQAGAFVSGKNPPDGVAGCPRLLRRLPAAAHPDPSVLAGQLQDRGVAQEGVAAPSLVPLRAFEHIAVAADGFQPAQHADRGMPVGVQLPADGDHPVIAGGGQSLGLPQSGTNHACFILSVSGRFPGKGIKKTVPDRACLCQGRGAYSYPAVPPCFTDISVPF